MQLLRSYRRIISSLMFVLLASWQIGQPLQAATFIWDGGNGGWDTTTSSWNSSSTTWINSTDSFAVFGGTPGTLTLTEPITAGGLAFNSTGSTVTGQILTLGGASPSISVGVTGDSVGSTGIRAVIDSVVAGTSGLTKSGSGVLVLTNNTNSYTGATSVKNGTLSISNMGQLGTSMTTVGIFGYSTGFAGSTLQLQGGLVDAAGLTFNRDLGLSGRGSFSAFGTALHSIGNNTITGDIATSSLVETRLSATAGTTTIDGNVSLGTGNVAQIVNGNGNVVINGVITGGSNGQLHLIKTTSGITTTLTLTNNNNTFLGATRVDSGTLRVSNGAQLGLGTSNNIGNLTFNNGTFEIRTDAPDSFADKNISYSSNSGTIFVDRAIGGSLLNQTVAFNNLRQENNRTFTFTGRNGYGVSIDSLTNSGNGANNEAWSYTGDGLLTVTGTTIWGEANTTGARTLTFTANGEVVVNSSITATGNNHIFTKRGTGTLTLNGSSATYSGATNIQQGTITVQSLGALGTGSTILIGGIGGTSLPATTVTAALEYTGIGEISSKVIELKGTSGGAVLLGNGTGGLTFTSNLTATGIGSKTLTLGGAYGDQATYNTIAGAIVDNSTTGSTTLDVAFKAAVTTITLGSVDGLTLGATITGTGIAAGTTVAAINTDTRVVTLSQATSAAGAAGQTITASGLINPTSVTKFGAGSWVLAGANTYTGSTTVTNGILAVVDTFAAGSRNILPDTNEIIFNADALTQSAGGVFAYVGDGANASVETVGTLTATAGAGTVGAISGAGGSAVLTFSSLGTISDGAGINFVTDAGSSITLTGAADTNGILDAHVFYNGADFASGSTVGAATYTTESGGASLAGSNTTPYLVNTTDIASQSTATINAGIKFTDTRALTLGAAQTLTLQNGAATVSGGLLVTGGSAVTISGGTGITSGGAAELVFRTDGAGDTLNLNASILATTTGGWTKLGAGTLVLGAANANTAAGSVNINEGTVQLNAAANALGADNVNVNLRQGAILDLNGNSLGTVASNTGAMQQLNGAGSIINSGAAASLRVLNSNSNSSYFTGTIGGDIQLVKGSGNGSFRIVGAQTYTGGVQINGGNVIVTSLANIGQASGLGTGDATSDATNAASLVFNGGNLYYRGSDGTIYQTTGTPSVSIDRLFTLAGNGAIFSEGSRGSPSRENTANHAALIFNNTAAVAFTGAGNRTLTLSGNSLGDNEIALQLIDNPNTGVLAITKASTGLWILSNTGNDYSGATTVSAGQLRIESAAYSTNTNTVLNGGILETSGNFVRDIGAAANQIKWTGTANGGFAASIASLTVNLGGGTPITWGSTANFSSTGQLLLNSTTALADVDFQNDLDLNAGTRTVNVADNTTTGTDFAILSGTITGSGTSNLTKTGNGLLYLTGANTYNGNTSVTAGSLAVSSIDGAGGSSNVGNATGQLSFGNGSTGTTYLMYYGTGETVNRSVRWNSTTGTGTIDSSGSGALILKNFSITGSGAKTLNLRGLNSDANAITSNIVNSGGATTVSKTDGGTWILSGTNTFTGNLNINSGFLGLASAASAGGTGNIVITNGGLFAAGGAPLTIGRNLQLAGNASSYYTGDQSIAFSGTVTGNAASNAQVWNIYNMLSQGATLTFNSFTSAEDTAADTRPLVVLGTGDTIFNATIGNHAAATTGGTSLTLNASFETATLTLAGGSPNTYTKGTTLTGGTLILAKVGALGATTGAVNLNGGFLQTTFVGGLIGANAIGNTITLGGTVALIGTESIEFGNTAAVTMGASRTLINNLSGGASLTISGTVTNTANSTLVFSGSGDTTIDGVIQNGTGTQALTLRGSGNLTLTADNTFGGSTSVENGVLILSGVGTLNPSGTGIATISGSGILRIDNSGTDVANRVNDTGDFNLDNGTLDFIGDADGSSETFGRLDINSVGRAKINMTGAGSNTLTFASVNFANSGSSLDLSSISGLGTTNKVMSTGNIVVSGTTTLASSNGIIPRVILGSDFAEYDATNGFQAFTGYDSSNDLMAALDTATMNVTASANIAGNRILNAIKIDDATGVDIGTILTNSNITLTLTSGAILATGGGTHSLNVPIVNLASAPGSSAHIQVTAGTTLNVNSVFVGSSIALQQGGTTVFNANQFYNGTTTVHAGVLKLNGGLNTIFGNKGQLEVKPGATVDLNGNIQFVGALSTSGAGPGSGGNITSTNGTSTIVADFTAGSATFNGVIDNVGGVINFGRTGTNTMTIGTVQTYSGWTFLTGGDTTLRDEATILNTSGIDINLGRLLMQNNDNLLLQNDNRINDSADINLRGGTIVYTSRFGANGTETLGAVSALLGANTITATATAGGAYYSAVLTLSSLTRSAGTTVNFTGTNLGQAGLSASIMLGTTPTTVGSLLLGSWAIANTTDYAAYVDGMGVGAVGSGGFTPYDTQDINAALVAPNAGIFASGAITNINARTNGSIQLGAGTTTTGLLRFGGAFTNDLEFTNGTDILNLELGGILRSNNNNLTSIGSAVTRGVITSGTSELVVYNNQNTLTIHSVIQGTTSLVKSGAGTLTLTAANTYSGGTYVDQGTLRLEGDPGAVVIPDGGLTLTAATVTMIGNSGQIDPGNAVTLNGSSTLTLVGDNTLDSLTFNHIGGTSNPTVTTNGILTLTNATPITVTSNSDVGLPVVTGALDFGTGAKTLNIGAIQMNGVIYDATINRSLDLTGVINAPGDITKTGAGLLGLGGQNNFASLTVAGGGIVLRASSTGTTPSTLVSGPLGIGLVTMAAGTRFSADNSSDGVANAFSFVGNPIFGNIGTTTSTMTLNGGLTFATLGTSGLVIDVETPYLNVFLGGAVTNMAAVTAIGGATGMNTITKTGPGNISGLNLTGVDAGVGININGLTNLNTFSLLHDGDGTSSFETINLGDVTWDPANGSNISLTIGRAGTGVNYATPAYKTIALNSLTSTLLPNGLTLTNNNGYGLLVQDDITLASGNSFSVSTANTSLQVAGLTLSGKISGANAITKAGNGTLKLGNATNDFTGTIDITNGTVEGASDGAFGNAANIIQIGSNSLAEGLRISGSFGTSRTIHLNAVSSGIDVTQGNTLTLNTAFTFSDSANALRKNDLGTLVLTQAQTGWDGVLTIGQGIVRISDGASLGTTTGNLILNNVGASLELDGSGSAVIVADAIRIASTNNSSSNGINSSGAIHSLFGNNTLTGAITIDTTTTDSNSRSGTLTADLGSTLNVEGGIVLGIGTGGSNRDNWIGFGGEGTINLTTNGITHTGNLTVNGYGWIEKFGSGTLNIQVADALTAQRVTVKSGTLSLNGSGTLGVPGSGGGVGDVYLNPTGILVLDNSGTAVDNRLSSRNINFSSGKLNIIGNGNAATSETVGTFTIREGLSIFTLDADASQSLDFSMGALSRTAGGTLVIRADNFGSASGAGVATVTGSSFPYVGQVGGSGTVTKGILPWALGDTLLTGAGIGFVTSDTAADTGTAILRLLAPSEQTTDLSTASANVNLSTNEALSSLISFNSLRLDNGGGVTLNYVPLNLESGGLLALSGNTGISGFSGVSYLTTTSDAELVIHNQVDLTLLVPIAATAGTLTKSGAGILTLTAGNTNHSTVSVNEGTLRLGGGDQTILPGRNMFVNEGATLDLFGTVQQVNILESRQSASLARNDVHFGGGTVINSSGTQATLAMASSSSVFAGSIQGNIAVVRSYAAGATGDWNLYSAQTYTGPTLLNGGRTILQDTASFSNTSSIEVSNATFLITASNNATEAANLTDRINDAASIILSGAMLQFRNRAALITTETMGAVTLRGGSSIIDFSEGGTGVNASTLTIGSLARELGSHTTLRFLNIDATPSDDQRLFIDTLNGVATTSIGDGLTNGIIGGWATFEREFASYIPGQGVGGLNTQGFAGYSPNLINNGTETDNIRIATPNAGSTTILLGDVTLNSLNIQAGTSSTDDSTLDLGGNTLTLASGGLILSPVATTALNIDMIVQNGNLTAGITAGPADLYLNALQWYNGQADNTGNADVRIDANIVDNGAGGVVTLVINGNTGRGSLAATNDVFINGNNTYTGGTFVNSGNVRLNNSSANGTTIVAVPGDLTIAGGYSGNAGIYSDRVTTVYLNAADQMANTGNLTVMGGGILNLNNFNQAIASLTFDNNGGNTPQVTTGSGTLTVTGNITAGGQNVSSGSTRIDGKLDLAAATTTITVNPVEWNSTILNPILPNLTINAPITGGNIIKAGTGVLRLSGSNGYTGSFDLQAGGVLLGSNNAFSSGAVTLGDGTFLSSSDNARTVANDFIVSGSFALRDAFNLTLSGAGSFAAGTHNIEVELAAKTLFLTGTLTGAGSINKTGNGILVLSNNSNAYTGFTTVSDGTLTYGDVDAIPTGSALTVLEGALVDITLGGSAVTVGSIASNSATQGGVIVTTATSGTTVFTAGGDNSSTSFGGVLVAPSGAILEFVKTGTGTLTLGGANQYNGSTTVEDGRLVAQPVSGDSPLGTSQALVMGSATSNSSGILQLGSATGKLDHTFTSLSSRGTGTENQIVSGNATQATLTLDLASTTFFAGNIGGAGTDEANLDLIKNGVADLSIAGTGTSTFNGTTTVNGGKLFMNTPGAFSATTAGLTLADGTEFSLRGTTNAANQVYGFSGTGNKITVGTSTGATLGFALDGGFNSQINLAAGQTMTVNGTFTTAIYVNSAPVNAQSYVLINGTDASSLGSHGAFDLNPVIFNGGSFTYTLSFGSGVDGGGADQWILTPTAIASAPDTWWVGDLDGLGTGVWSATTTSGTGSPSNWATDSTGVTDALVPPDELSVVHFSATGAANFATTLGAHMTIEALFFHTGNAATTIGSSNGVNTLTLGNTSDPSGITLEAGAGDVGISVEVILAQNQSWNVEGAARQLTLSAGLSGTAMTLTINDAVTNAGSLILSGTAGTLTGTLNLNSGSLIFDDAGSLNTGAGVVLGTATTAATLQVGNTTEATNAIIGGLSNGAFSGSRVIGGNATNSTLTIGPASGTATFAGAVGGVGTNENSFNLVKAGAGIQILDGAVTYAGSTTVNEGTLQLGSSSSFAPTVGSLSVIANAGTTATMDFNGKSYTTVGTTTLGGGTDGIAQIIGSGSTLTLGGDIVYDATNDPGAAVISTNLASGSANRVISVGDSANTTNELTFNGTFTGTTNNNLTFNGAGSGTINGNIAILSGSGTTKDVNFSSTGTWTVNAKIEVTDTISINSGVVNATVGESLDATNDVVVDGTGTPGSAIVNISSTAQVHTGDDIFIRNGGLINVKASGGIGTGTDQLVIGDSSSTTAGSAGVLNLDSANISVGANGIFVGNSTQIGHITGTGFITTAGSKDLRNGSIAEGITLAGNGAIVRQGLGTLTFYGARAAASTGDTLIRDGVLVLDYSLNNASKIGDVLQLGYAVTSGNATLIMNGSSTASIAETMLSTTILPGHTTVAINNGTGQTATLNLNAITRSVPGGTVAFEYSSVDAKVTSTNPAGMLGWATLVTGIGDERFAAIDGSGNIVEASFTTQNDVTAWASGQNIINDAAFSGLLSASCTDISSLTFSVNVNATVSMGAGADLTISSGGIMVDSAVGARDVSIVGGTLYGSTSGSLGEIIVHQNNLLGTLTIASNIVRSSGITKTGVGTLILSGSNTFVGTGSELNISEGIVQLSGGNAIGDTTAVRIRTGAKLDLANSNETIGSIMDESGGTLVLGTGDLTINQTLTADYRGVVTGTAGSVLTLNAVSRTGTTTYNLNFTGGTTTGFTGTVVVNAGLLQLSAGGTLANATAFTINKNGTLLLDNNGSTRSGARISDAATITLNSADGTFGGAVQVRGLGIRTDQNTTSSTSETVGVVTFNSGANYAFLDNQGGTSSRVTLATAGFVRSNNATLDVRGRLLGDTNGSAAWSQFEIGADATENTFVANNLVGNGSGTAGGTNTDVKIIPWAIGERYTGNLGNANMGNTFVTYVLNAGFKPLDLTSEYATYALAGSNDNVRESLTADLTGLTGKTINSLIIHNNSTAASTIQVTGNGVGEALTNFSGAFLFTLNTAAVASSVHSISLGGFDDGILVGGSEYVFHVVNPSAAADTATVSVTISSSLNSTADITKSGRGTLIFTGVTNTAGGGSNKTTLNEGMLEIAGLGSIGGSTGNIVFAGGGLRLGTGFADDFSTRTISILEGGGTIDTNGANIVIGTFGAGGGGGLTKLGAGNLTLTTVATYTGGTNVDEGQIQINATNTLSVSGDLRVGNGTTIGALDLNGFDQTIGSLSSLGNNAGANLITVDLGNTLTINGDILLSNDADGAKTNLTIGGGGAVIVNGVDITVGMNAGGTDFSSRAVLDLTDLSSFSATLTGDLIIQKQGDNNANDAASMLLSDTANTLTANNIFVGASAAGSQLNTLQLGAGTNVIHVALIHLGSGDRDSGVVKFGGVTGSLVLRSNDDCAPRADVILGPVAAKGTGYTTANVFDVTGHSADIAIGTLSTSIGAKTAANTSDFKFDQGTLDILSINMAVAKGTGTSTNTLSIGGGTVLLGGSATYGDAGTGTVSLATAGSGELAITGGTVTSSVGIIRGAGTGTATVTLDGGALDMTGNNIGTATEDVTLTAASGTLSNVGELNGGGSLTKTTAGILILEGTNTYSGATTISAGTLQIGSGGSTGTLGTDTGVITNNGTLSFNRSDALTIANVISGTGEVAQNGGGTTTLGGVNDYTGKTTVTGGKLSISAEDNLGTVPGSFAADHLTLDGGILQTTADLSISANRGITLGASGGGFEVDATKTTTVSSIITGTGVMTKDGAGTLILTASNTNTGATTVNAGVLGGTGTLNGTWDAIVDATVGGDLTVASGGTLAPGTTVEGLLTIGGNLNVESGGTLLMQLGGATLNDDAAIRGFENDLTGISGTIIAGWEGANTVSLHDHIFSNDASAPVINGTLKIDSAFLNGYTPVFGDVFDLLDWSTLSNSITGTTSFDFSGVVLGTELAFNTDLFASNGIIVVVPEPSRAFLLLLGLLGLMLRRRRR